MQELIPIAGPVKTGKQMPQNRAHKTNG